MTLLMTSGEFDLSVSSVFGFAPVLMWTLFNSGTAPLEVGFHRRPGRRRPDRAGQWLVRDAARKIPSFLVTLGMLLVVRGTALFISDGFPQRTWNAGEQLAWPCAGRRLLSSARFRVYMSLFWFIAAALAMGYVLNQTRAGNWIQAAGGNPARRGPQRRRRPHQDRAVRAARSTMAALAGVISSIRTSAANPNSGTGYELEVIAMVVIGGTALSGGARHHPGHRAGHLHPAGDAQRHRPDRRARPRLQHLHRRDHPGDDGAALLLDRRHQAGTCNDGRTPDPHGAYQQVSTAGSGRWRTSDLDGRRGARSSACSATTAPASRR